MTDEQIKQNAKKYAIENYGEYDEHDYTDHSGSNMCNAVSEKAFIAGAHSRDEKIQELKEEIESLKEQYNSCFEGFSKRGTKLIELMKENVKLSNPWISVEERFPEEDKDEKDWSVEVYVRNEYGGTTAACYNYKRKEWHLTYGSLEGDSLIHTDITHWMPIPELKKEE